ncbi:hypothetical protein C8R45DRAFT_1183009 [Mycena sanguinolenta]|nr:hypothetical protein C8R45DRAFT_1183009 [Mycena sanguinolenta]
MTDHHHRARAPTAHVAGAINSALEELKDAVSAINVAISAFPDVPLGLRTSRFLFAKHRPDVDPNVVEASLADLSGTAIALNIAVSDLSEEISVAFAMPGPAARATGISAPDPSTDASAPAPVIGTGTSTSAPAPTSTNAAPVPAVPAVNAGAFHTTGPWIAGRLYSVVPLAPLAAEPREVVCDHSRTICWFDHQFGDLPQRSYGYHWRT